MFEAELENIKQSTGVNLLSGINDAVKSALQSQGVNTTLSPAPAPVQSAIGADSKKLLLLLVVGGAAFIMLKKFGKGRV